MALWPFLLIREDVVAIPALMRHERIHFCQQLELLILPFYIFYGAEYLWHRVRGMAHHEAYRALSFEREAYGNDGDAGYLERRRRWGMWR